MAFQNAWQVKKFSVVVKRVLLFHINMLSFLNMHYIKSTMLYEPIIITCL